MRAREAVTLIAGTAAVCYVAGLALGTAAAAVIHYKMEPFRFRR